MNNATQLSQTISAPAPVKSAGEAEALMTHFAEVMDGLIAVVQQETELVRAGRLGAAMKLAQHKGDLTRLYIADMLRLRVSQPFLSQSAPDKVAALRNCHDKFRALLQINLTVLATAHAVSEGIVRGVSGELAKKSSPQTYGASGRANAPGRSAQQPLAVSRVL